MVVHHAIVSGQVWVRNSKRLVEIGFDEGQQPL